MAKYRFLGMALLVELLVIAAIAAACAASGFLFYFFYNGIYGLALSVLLPLYYVRKKKETPRSIGIAPMRARQWIVAAAFVALSVGGQMIPLLIEGIQPEWGYLAIGFFPLVMTTFFEELLFRGFLQTRLEERFGPAAAVALSGLLFSLYHLGYPGFRSLPDIALLFAVGLGFALAYKLSGNNLAAAYLVNLPNALLTYMLRHAQFPAFDGYSTLFAVLSIAAICIVMAVGARKIGRQPHA